ncbi:MAG: hypothetical protein JJD92_02865 [Frankiaceae bacterium]|nr:hypothetical protein [Frankiaceae bacterium]
MRRTALPALVVLALALAGCAGESATDTTASPSPAASPSSSPPPSAVPSVVPPSSPAAVAADQTLRVTYAAGKVSGDIGLVNVKQNSTVALVVTSDVADEVHVHGYDKKATVARGGTVTILFRATLQGRWEVELEDLGRRLVQLQVR